MYSTLQTCKDEAQSNKIFISREHLNKDILSGSETIVRRYKSYDSWLTVFINLMKLPLNSRNQHEVITGNTGCKLYADIDIDKGSDWVLEDTVAEFISCTKAVFAEYKVLTFDPQMFRIFINASTARNYGSSPCSAKQSIHIVYTRFTRNRYTH